MVAGGCAYDQANPVIEAYFSPWTFAKPSGWPP